MNSSFNFKENKLKNEADQRKVESFLQFQGLAILNYQTNTPARIGNISSHTFYIPVNDVMISDTSPPKSWLTTSSVYRPPGWNSPTDPPHLALLASLFDSPLHLVLMGDLNAGHATLDTLFCNRPYAFFDAKLVTLVQESLVFPHSTPIWCPTYPVRSHHQDI